ncbi:peroxisomal membrane protein PEX16 [Gautieria morchelliformis]|nr:peroxisomal membrane protein PEX16 [Gautieria morchelliformis]
MSPFQHYEAFLIQNSSTISTIESSLRSVTWFLPGRFKDAELASEALSATLNILSLYHDTIIARRVAQCPKFKPLIPPSVNSRYTRAWAEKEGAYKWAARMLEMIKYVELLIEMGLQRKVGQKGRWRGIVLLELIKAVLRVVILRITRRPLMSPPIPERDFDPSSLPPLESEAPSPPLASSSTPLSAPEHLKNNHISLDVPNPILSQTGTSRSTSPVESYLLPKALSPSSVRPPTSLVRPLATPKDWMAELVHILRPLVYVIALSRQMNSAHSLVLSLSLDLSSRCLRRVPPPSSALERAEYARRDRDLLWYFFRGPIWSSYTRPKLVAFADKTATAPVLGLVSAFMKDWMPLIDDYYYYTAT